MTDTPPAFDPSLYVAFRDREAAIAHKRRVVCLATTAGAAVGEVLHPLRGHLSGGLCWPRDLGRAVDVLRWRYVAPFREPFPFDDARAGLTHLLKPGARMVDRSEGVGALSVLGAVVIFEDEPRRPCAFSSIEWTDCRPWCPVWDAPKPSEEELRRKAANELADKIIDLCNEYNCNSVVTIPPDGITAVARIAIDACLRPGAK